MMPETDLQRLEQVLERHLPRLIACSGGVDSLLLATIAHRQAPQQTWIVHATGPAVPAAATRRVEQWARQEKWQLELVDAGEFQDPDYLANPVNRCFHCKKNLYGTLHQLRSTLASESVLLSGTNLDDLQDFRPGLQAAERAGVCHPWVEAEITKSRLRQIARMLGLPFADLPAAPCLASRLYTGTAVEAAVLQQIDQAETWIREQTGWAVVRCRVRETELRVEIEDPSAFTEYPRLQSDLERLLLVPGSRIRQVTLDSNPYRAGRAVVRTSEIGPPP